MDAWTLWAGILQIATVVLILALLYRPLGDWIARTYTSVNDWRVERGVYRLVGVDPRRSRPGRLTFAGFWRSHSWACCSSTHCSACRPLLRTRSGLPPCPRDYRSARRSPSSPTRTGSPTRLS